MNFMQKLASLFRADAVVIKAPIIGGRKTVEKWLQNSETRALLKKALNLGGPILAPIVGKNQAFKQDPDVGFAAEALVLAPQGLDPPQGIGLPGMGARKDDCGSCCWEEIERIGTSHYGPDRHVRVATVFDQCAMTGRTPPYPAEYIQLMSELASQFVHINAHSIENNLDDDASVAVGASSVTVSLVGDGQIGFGMNALVGRLGDGVKGMYTVAFSGLLRDGTPFAYTGLKRSAPSGTAQHASYPFKVVKMTEMHYLGQLFDADVPANVTVSNLLETENVNAEAIFGGDDLARYLLKGVVGG